MAVNLDTRLPLAAIGDRLNPAGMMQQAMQFRQQQQQNALAQRLAEMKADYEARKMKREQQTEQFMGEELGRMTAGQPAIERTEYVWQQPKQVVEQAAIPPREVTLEDMQQAGIRAMMRAGDLQGAFEAMKAARAGQQQQMRSYGADFKIGPNGEYYAPNLTTGRLEPTGVMAPAIPAKPNITLRETGRGIEAIDLAKVEPGTVFTPPKKEEKPDVTPYQRIQLEGQLRDDYRTDSKTYSEIKRQSSIIKAALNDPSAAGTLSAATAYMKMLDPGSVVRESELAMAMNTQGAIDRLQSYWTTIQMGKVLTPQQKADFARLSDQYLMAAEEAQRNLNKRYSDLASGVGVDPKRVVMYDVKSGDAKRPIDKARNWLKSQRIQNQQQFNAAVQQLKKQGWTDDEIRKAAEGM